MAKLEKLSQALCGLTSEHVPRAVLDAIDGELGSLPSDCYLYVKDLEFSVLQFLAVTCGKYLFLCSVCLLHSLFFS